MDNKLPDVVDSEIIRRVTNGEVNAFELLMEKYGDMVSRIVSRHIPHAKSEEVVQDVFVRIYQSLGSYSAKSPFSFWLSKIAVRCCYDFWRQQHRKKEFALSGLTEDHQNWIDAVQAAESREVFEREASRREAAEVLEYALGKLSAEDRMVLTMVYLEGIPVAEVAGLLGRTGRRRQGKGTPIEAQDAENHLQPFWERGTKEDGN